MARRAATKTAINTELQKGRRHTQRQRLTAGTIAAANRFGYAGASVSAIIEQAGISRPTFYDYFKDREECLLATTNETEAQVIDEVARAVADAGPQDAVAVAISTLIGLARTQPEAMRFLLNEVLAGGTVALEIRDQGLKQIEQIIAARHKRLPATAATPDAPISILFGAIQRVLGGRLRRGDPGLSSLEGELQDWVARYHQPRAQQRRHKLRAGPEPGRPATAPALVLTEPAALPPGRPRLSPEEVAENQRQRILHAVARLAQTQGYEASTIAEIAKEAKVDPSVFYSLFANKQDAFMAYHELGFQQLMGVTGAAFFNGDTWPKRSWQAGLAFAHFLAENPLVAHTGFVEAYAVGPRAVQRVEDSHVAFTVFLQEGYRYAAQEHPPGKVELEAIVAAIYEVVYREVRGGRAAQLPRMLGLIAVLFLAPFTGVEGANRSIDAALGASRDAGKRGGARRKKG